MYSSRTQGGPLMNRLTFPCLSVVVCFLLLLARRMHVSFSHAWSASKPKEKSEDTEMYYSSHTFSGCSKNCQCIFQQSFEKEPDFPEICEIRSKKCQEKVLYLELWENAISQPVGDIYWGKVNQPVTTLEWTNTMPQEAPLKKAPWQTYHMWTVTAQSTDFSSLFDIPMNLAFHWSAVNQVIERENNSQSLAESHSYKARHGNESLRKNARSRN